MIKLFTFLWLVVAGSVHAQDDHLIPPKKWSKKFYISDEFCASKGLKPGETNGLLRAWNAETKDKGFFRVVDIRRYFKSSAEASQYLKLNLPTLSEKGDQVQSGIEIKGVSNLYVFKEGAGIRKLNEALGVKNYMYFFLFTVRNYLAKIFVSTEKQIPLEEAASYAREATKRLNAAIKN